MKKLFLIIILIFAVIGILLLGSILYVTRYKITVVDTVQSADEVYEAVLQAVGDPGWPFGPAPGQLVLKKNNLVISKTDFMIANDGAPFSAGAWSVTWFDDYVKITLSGKEQYDELIILYYDGKVERLRLTTHWGIETETAGSSVAEDMTASEDDSDYEFSSEQQLINDGYRAIYKLFSDNSIDNFEIYYGASESSSRCILSEDENTIDYLVYNGQSENEKCGLYVYYQSKKNADGTCSYTDGTIVDIYAYAYENGEVVSSGITYWNNTGSEYYQKITGEK